jgi:hypothetical protein
MLHFFLSRIRENEELHDSMLSILNSLKQLGDDIQNEDRLRQLGNFGICNSDISILNYEAFLQ